MYPRYGSYELLCDAFANLPRQDEVAAAEPSIDEKTSKLVSKGRWSVPGYKVRSCLSMVFDCFANRYTIGKIRRSLHSIDGPTYPFPLCTLAL